jgi:hypothetical protein
LWLIAFGSVVVTLAAAGRAAALADAAGTSQAWIPVYVSSLAAGMSILWASGHPLKVIAVCFMASLLAGMGVYRGRSLVGLSLMPGLFVLLPFLAAVGQWLVQGGRARVGEDVGRDTIEQ